MEHIANPKAKKVVDVARKLKLQNWPGQAVISNQCAKFVRKAFTEAGFDLPIVSNPTDAALVRAQHKGFGPELADSFAGEAVGSKVDWRQSQPGDIIMFKNTDPSYTSGTITHVGICIGQGQMIDRGGHGVWEQPVTAYGSGNIVEVRRPRVLLDAHGAASAAHGKTVKLFVHDGKTGGNVNGASLSRLDVSLRMLGGQLHAFVDGHEVKVKGLSLEMFL
jgi:hypothetical protein